MERLFEDLISKEQFATEVGVSPKTVSNWVSSGKISGVKIGRKHWLLKSTIEKWLSEREMNRAIPANRRRRGRLSS